MRFLRVAITVILVGALATGLGKILGRFAGETFTGRVLNPADEISSALSAAASEMNAGLPMMVDRATELMHVVGFKDTFTYNYRLVELTAADVEGLFTDDFGMIGEIRPDAVRQACSTPVTREGLLDRGITMQYAYHDQNREYLTAYTISLEDCKEAAL